MYFKSFIFALITLSSFKVCAESSGALFTIEDLTILKEQQNTKEFFSHVLDISPAARNTEYHQLIAEMAYLRTQKILGQEQIGEKDFESLMALNSYLSVAENELFQENLKVVFLKYMKTCFTKYSYQKCEQETLSFWKKYSGADFGIKLSRIFSPFFNKEMSYSAENQTAFVGSSPLLLQNLLTPAFLHPLSEFYCKRAEFQKTAFNLIINFPQDINGFKKAVLDTFHPDCIKSLQAINLKWIAKADPRQQKRLVRLITDKKEQLTYTHYLNIKDLLSSNLKKEELNQRWGSLKKLKNSSPLRQMVLDLIKEDPNLKLGYLNKNKVGAKQKMLTKHININFPELFKTLKDNCRTPKFDIFNCNQLELINKLL